ncbi:IS1380 family transposase [Pseudarthrobacter sp. S9]|uniref:IS1380 family transposase n=1 Tax=Pseudarthrobacter sp. S9 TaxID=3418421 RepID=UPI003CFFA908
MQLFHTQSAISSAFDDPNLVSAAGLVPVMGLAGKTGLGELVDEHLKLPDYFGANAGLKITALVAGMVAGADSIDDMGLLRHGGMGKLFKGTYAPSTLGSFLRTFTFGHVRQLDAVASRWLPALARAAPVTAGIDALALVDIDDTVKATYGYQKQGTGYGYNGVKGLNALIGTVTTNEAAPVITGARLRKGATSSARGAGKFVADTLANVNRLRPADADGMVLLRADSAFYNHAVVTAAARAGAKVSITARMDPHVKKAIAKIPDSAWEKIKYTNAIFDEESNTWISDAEVAEIGFTAFISKKKEDRVTGRLVVRRVPELNPKAVTGQETLFDTHRFHAFFTTVAADVLDTVKADKTHRAHAVIEQVHSDLRAGPLAHLPSGKFNANAAWLAAAAMAFNLTRAAGTLAGGHFAKATTVTIRTKIINVAARTASSARRIRLHLPENWPWQDGWEKLFDTIFPPPKPA